MSFRQFQLAAAIGWLLSSACAPEPEAPPELTRDESRLVDLYLRVAILEALHAEHPDSVATELDRLHADHDSLAVDHALAYLETHPHRWELIHDTLSKRLAELEQYEDDWWELVRGHRSLAEPLE